MWTTFYFVIQALVTITWIKNFKIASKTVFKGINHFLPWDYFDYKNIIQTFYSVYKSIVARVLNNHLLPATLYRQFYRFGEGKAFSYFSMLEKHL